LDGKLEKMNDINHNPKSYWMLGCVGPFSIINPEHTEKVEYNILLLNESICPKQTDGCNCGIIWCLFIYNMMMQARVSYNFNPNELQNYLPTNIGIGKTWLFPKLFNALKNLKSPFHSSTEITKM
jgi:hypothetical protein